MALCSTQHAGIVWAEKLNEFHIYLSLLQNSPNLNYEFSRRYIFTRITTNN